MAGPAAARDGREVAGRCRHIATYEHNDTNTHASLHAWGFAYSEALNQSGLQAHTVTQVW